MKIYCPTCKVNTNHEVLKEVKDVFHDHEEQVTFYDDWQIIQCKGCETKSFRQASWDTTGYDYETDSPSEIVKLYPIRSEKMLPLKGYYNAQTNVRSVYRETIDAYNNDMPLLCAGGLRATIESICNAEGVADGPVEKIKAGKPVIVRTKDLMGKINGLSEKGFITKKQSEIIHEHRYLGNEALHELGTPSKSSLKTAIEIIEHVLDTLYEIADKGAQLTYQRENREKKKKTSGKKS